MNDARGETPVRHNAARDTDTRVVHSTLHKKGRMGIKKDSYQLSEYKDKKNSEIVV